MAQTLSMRKSTNVLRVRQCAMWRIPASLFGPETTAMRHQCVTVLAQNDTGILTTAKKPRLDRRLSEARQCTEVTHHVHFARTDAVREEPIRASLVITCRLHPPSNSRTIGPCLAPRFLRPIAETRPCRRTFGGCHPRTPTIGLSRDERRSPLVDDPISCRGPMGRRGIRRRSDVRPGRPFPPSRILSSKG